MDEVYFMIPASPYFARTIESFDESACDRQFRFLKRHLHPLFRSLVILPSMHLAQLSISLLFVLNLKANGLSSLNLLLKQEFELRLRRIRREKRLMSSTLLLRFRPIWMDGMDFENDDSDTNSDAEEDSMSGWMSRILSSETY